jgi:dTDP-4-amino-4,6-dideoxygalactose transaminase
VTAGPDVAVAADRAAPPPVAGSRWRVPLSDLKVDDAVARAVDDVVRSGWWSMGPRVAAFETAFRAFCGSGHALAVSNGTAALHLALLAAGCGRHDEVIVPSLNFVAAANAIVHTGASPVFVDIAGDSDLNVDVGDVASAITPATRAIVVLHYGGHAAPIHELVALARAHGLVVIEDAAHAPGTLVGGRACGTFGDMGCFSFFSNKNLPTGEGGMIVTDDETLAERIRLLRSHGMTTLTWDRHRGHASSYDVVANGFNYRLDELRAAIGIVHLPRLERENAARARTVARYRAALDGERGIAMPFDGDSDACAHHLAVVVLPEGVEREDVRVQLVDGGVQTSVHYPPIHRFSQFRERTHRPLPRTDAVADRLLTLPLYPHLDDERVDYVCERLLEAVQ